MRTYKLCGGELGRLHASTSTEMSPHITVLYFAAASTSTGFFEQTITLPTSTSEPPNFPLASLAPLLISLHPNTGLDKVLEVSRWSVNAEMIPESDVGSVFLHGGEEVAVICPVSGG
ncbi:hypothetical protein J3R82DRAFT_11894 [Butyriboletus roseoflavus]|nr:hypothetical protein J3R82DRAFT_11894 [Butyriboletus roseoflavus]